MVFINVLPDNGSISLCSDVCPREITLDIDSPPPIRNFDFISYIFLEC